LTNRVVEDDLANIISQTRNLWEEIRGETLFITGGTGFFGRWLLGSFVRANDEFGLNARALVLSRSPETFASKCPELAKNPALTFVRGDVRDFEFPRDGCSHLIHAAAEVDICRCRQFPVATFDTIALGTRRVLDFANMCGVRKFLFVSSGAVYGAQPREVEQVEEDFVGAPDPLDAQCAYAHGKRAAEALCGMYASSYGLDIKVARCFSFVGPHLSLDRPFAAASFMRDAVIGGPIVVQGDGTPVRSYLYASDLTVWLWTILFRGRCGRAYNVGSDRPISIETLARTVAREAGLAENVVIGPTLLSGNCGIVAEKSARGLSADRYVPSVERARSELGLLQTVEIDEAIRRSLDFHLESRLSSETTGRAA